MVTAATANTHVQPLCLRRIIAACVISSLVWLDNMADSSTWNICHASLSQQHHDTAAPLALKCVGAVTFSLTLLPSS